MEPDNTTPQPAQQPPLGSPTPAAAKPPAATQPEPIVTVTKPPSTPYLTILWTLVFAGGLKAAGAIMVVISLLSYKIVSPQLQSFTELLSDTEWLVENGLAIGLLAYGAYRLRRIARDTSGFVGFNFPMYLGAALSVVIWALYSIGYVYLINYELNAAYSDSSSKATSSYLKDTAEEEGDDSALEGDMYGIYGDIELYYTENSKLPSTFADLATDTDTTDMSYAVDPLKSTDPAVAARTFQLCGDFTTQNLKGSAATPNGSTPIPPQNINFTVHDKGRYCYNIALEPRPRQF
jgi:hypothetical protein